MPMLALIRSDCAQIGLKQAVPVDMDHNTPWGLP